MKDITRTLVLSAALTASLFAQDNNEAVYQLPPVVVTGELWQSELQKTTASVTVLDEAVLGNNGIQHFEDVINAIPNLSWTGGTSRPRYLQIRGIGENSQFEGETPDSSVRFLMDDFDLTGLGTVGNLFDVQQVEVLRGPQAGAFGANAAGGVVKIVGNEPTPYWSGQTKAGIGNDNLREMGVAVGGPILANDPEQLTFRFSINSLTQDGFRKNQFLDRDDTNERDELASRLKVRWLPNENWSFEGGLLYAEADNGFDEFTLNNSRTDTYSDEPGRDEQETRGASLRTAYDGLDKVELSYVGQFTDSDSLYSYDSDWGAGAGATGDNFSTYTGFLSVERARDVHSHELSVDSKDYSDALGWIDRWTVGLFYHELVEDSLINAFYNGWLDTAVSEYSTETIALFGQASHDFNERTRLTVGLRYENHDVDFESRWIGAGLEKATQNDDLWGGKISLEHDLNEEHTAFINGTRGYKAGGANSGIFREAFDPATYDTETLYNFELGLRSGFFNNKVNTSLTLFYLRRDDAQFRDSKGAGGYFRYLTVNGDTAEHFGLEAEASWQLDADWKLSVALGLLDTDHSDYMVFDDDGSGSPVPVRVESRELSNAPTYTYSARLDYAPREGLFASAELVGSDDYYESNSHDQRRDAFAIVNASIGYRFENWTVTLWTKNIFDEEYAERVFYFANDDPNYIDVRRYEAPAAPRTFGVTANYRW